MKMLEYVFTHSLLQVLHHILVPRLSTGGKASFQGLTQGEPEAQQPSTTPTQQPSTAPTKHPRQASVEVPDKRRRSTRLARRNTISTASTTATSTRGNHDVIDLDGDVSDAGSEALTVDSDFDKKVRPVPDCVEIEVSGGLDYS